MSDTLRRLAGWRGTVDVAVTRGPADVERQLGKFLRLDSTTELEGSGALTELDREVWERYIDSPMALARAATVVLNELEAAPPSHTGDPTSSSGSVAQQVPGPSSGATLSRDELLAPFIPEPARPPVAQASPVQVDATKQDRALAVHESTRMKLARFLASHGLELAQGLHEHKDLRIDLGVKVSDLTWIVEVKSLPPGSNDRDQLRYGLGQLLWYRSRWRAHSSDRCIGVLCVERCPADHRAWQAVCADASVVLTWPARFDSLLTECAALATRERLTYES